jgi:hypothetical protein
MAAAAANGGGAQQLEPSGTTGAAAAPGKPVAESATQGKLMEIDLGDEARARNIVMTERARRRALGEATEDEDSGASSSRPRKVRLGRDGKPWRGRNRRNSEDVKRDQLVDEFLKENRRKSLIRRRYVVYLLTCHSGRLRHTGGDPRRSRSEYGWRGRG